MKNELSLRPLRVALLLLAAVCLRLPSAGAEEPAKSGDAGRLIQMISAAGKFLNFQSYDIAGIVTVEQFGPQPVKTSYQTREILGNRFDRLRITRLLADKTKETTVINAGRCVSHTQPELKARGSKEDRLNDSSFSPGAASISEGRGWMSESTFYRFFGVLERPEPLGYLLIDWLKRPDSLQIVDSSGPGKPITIRDNRLGFDLLLDPATGLPNGFERWGFSSSDPAKKVLIQAKYWSEIKAFGDTLIPLTCRAEYFDGEGNLANRVSGQLKAASIKINEEAPPGVFDYALPLGCSVNDSIRKIDYRVSNFEPEIPYEEVLKDIQSLTEKLKKSAK